MQQPIKEERKEKEEGRKKEKEEGTAQGLAGAHLTGYRRRSPRRISLGLTGDPWFVFLFCFCFVFFFFSGRGSRSLTSPSPSLVFSWF
jgi:hypothetical protein